MKGASEVKWVRPVQCQADLVWIPLLTMDHVTGRSLPPWTYFLTGREEQLQRYLEITLEKGTPKPVGAASIQLP